MTAGIHNFVCERGAEFKRKISWVDVEGEPIDTTDFWIEMQVRKTFGDDLALITLSADNGGSWGGAPGFFDLDGQITLYIDAATTRNFEPGIYVYDIVVGMDVSDVSDPDPQNRWVRLMQGQFTVNDWVTETMA